MKKLLTTLIILGLLAVGAYAVYVYRIRPSETPESKYQTVAAERGRLTPTIGTTGTVRSNQTAALYGGISGIVERVDAMVGARVALQRCSILRTANSIVA